jgi:lipopolysaccharide/colanic/teichoic acid biosynthesis glycosyltransferase
MLDITGALAGIFLFFPFFLILPIIIKLTSKGSVLFLQERIGKGGKTFKFMKFRSMTVDNDPKIHQEYVRSLIKNGDRDTAGIKKLTCDHRITAVGAFLRRTSLDELPQFFNILMGDMSLVGPRPAIPYEVKDYAVWHKRRLYEVKPGLTGIWQVKGRSVTTFNEMVRMDIEYLESWSLITDLKLLFQTPLAIMSTRGAL